MLIDIRSCIHRVFPSIIVSSVSLTQPSIPGSVLCSLIRDFGDSCPIRRNVIVAFPDASFLEPNQTVVVSQTPIHKAHPETCSMSQPRAPSQTHLPARNRSRSPISRPTTPLRPSSRSSFRTSQNNGFIGPSPLDAFEPQFAELSDSMADLEANLMHLQLMHESLSRFGENFASFLYGLNMNAFVVDFPEVSSWALSTTTVPNVSWQAPVAESIKRLQKCQGQGNLDDQSVLLKNGEAKLSDAEATFLATDTSFTSLKATPRRKTVAPPITPSTASTMRQSNAPSRGGNAGRASRGAGRGARGSGLPRGRARGSK